jgi:methylglyoxal synthase
MFPMGAGSLRVALIAHDACKQDMLEWARWNVEFLSRLQVWATRNTGELVAGSTGLPVRLLLSGPLGGDAQIAAMIARGELDMVVFFWDPLATHAHAPDVQGLIRLAVVHNIAIACNRRSADLMMSSRILSATAA